MYASLNLIKNLEFLFSVFAKSWFFSGKFLCLASKKVNYWKKQPNPLCACILPVFSFYFTPLSTALEKTCWGKFDLNFGLFFVLFFFLHNLWPSK